MSLGDKFNTFPYFLPFSSFFISVFSSSGASMKVNISEKEREEIRKIFKAIEDIMNMPPEEKLKLFRRNNDLTAFL